MLGGIPSPSEDSLLGSPIKQMRVLTQCGGSYVGVKTLPCLPLRHHSRSQCLCFKHDCLTTSLDSKLVLFSQNDLFSNHFYFIIKQFLVRKKRPSSFQFTWTYIDVIFQIASEIRDSCFQSIRSTKCLMKIDVILFILSTGQKDIPIVLQLSDLL